MYYNPRIRCYYFLCMVEKTEAMKATARCSSSHGYLMENQKATLKTCVQSLNNIILLILPNV